MEKTWFDHWREGARKRGFRVQCLTEYVCKHTGAVFTVWLIGPALVLEQKVEPQHSDTPFHEVWVPAGGDSNKVAVAEAALDRHVGI